MIEVITIKACDSLSKMAIGATIRDSKITGFQAVRAKKGVLFRYEYKDGYGRDGDTKRLTIGRYGSLTVDQARDIASEYSVAKASGRDPAKEKARKQGIPRLDKFAEDYFKVCEEIAKNQPFIARIRLSTLKVYRGYMKNHIGPTFGNKRLDQITRKDIKEFHQRLSIKKPPTANRCLELISSLYKQAWVSEILPPETNPTSGVIHNKERKIQRFLTGEELVRLGEALMTAETVGLPYTPPPPTNPETAKFIYKKRPPYVIDTEATNAIRLYVFCGARAREVLGAKWSQIDFERRTLTVFGKTGERAIYLPEPAIEILLSMPRRSEYVFPSLKDPSKARSDLNRPWRAIRKFARLLGIRLHDLRHSLASVAASGGASLPIIGKLLGHSQMASTQRYAHLADDPLMSTAEYVAAHVNSALLGNPPSQSALKRR
jgi:integrase